MPLINAESFWVSLLQLVLHRLPYSYLCFCLKSSCTYFIFIFTKAFFCVILRFNYSKRLICSDSVQNLFGLWLTQLTNQPEPLGHIIKLFPNTLSVAAVFMSSYFCLKFSKLLGKNYTNI